MAWVIAWRRVEVITPSFLAHHAPQQRRWKVTDLPLCTMPHAPAHELPLGRRAGPCGTVIGRSKPNPSAWTQTVLAILELQALWHVPGASRFAPGPWGAPRNSGPRGRQLA